MAQSSWKCRICSATVQPTPDIPMPKWRCSECNATRYPTGNEKARAAKEEARRQAALRGELWSAVVPPPIAEGVAAVVAWLNDVVAAHTRAIAADFPDQQKLRLMQQSIKALTRGKNRENAPHRENVLKLRLRERSIGYLDAVIAELPPTDDRMALPLWHFNRLAVMLYDIAQIPELSDEAAVKYRMQIESHQSGIYCREMAETEELTREAGVKDVHAAAANKDLVWPVIATANRPAIDREVLFCANPGPQTSFVESDVDEILYGGRTGGGKSAGLLIAALEHLMAYPHTQNNALIVRNTWAEVPRQPFYLMSVSGLGKLQARGYPVQWHGDTHYWDLGPFGKLWFGYLDSLAAANRYQGGEFSFFGIDEATLIPPEPVEIIASERMRCRPGTPARVRLTANPGGPYHGYYLRTYAPWLDRRQQYMEAAAAGVVPIAAPCEVLHYIIENGKEVWVDAGTKGAHSRTYIPAGVENTPQYDVEDYLTQMEKIRDPLRKAQMMLGDWSAEYSAGKVFKRSWFKTVSELPRPIRRYVRAWDMAWGISNSACYTAGVLMGEMEGGGWVVLDVMRLRGSEGTTRPVIRAVADADRSVYGRVPVRLPADMGLSGITLRDSFVRELAGHDVQLVPDKGDKIERVRPLAAQAEYGHIYILHGSHPSREIAADLVRRGIDCTTGYQWVDGFLAELESVDPEKPKVGWKDQMDAFNGAFEFLQNTLSAELPKPGQYRGASAAAAKIWASTPRRSMM